MRASTLPRLDRTRLVTTLSSARGLSSEFCWTSVSLDLRRKARLFSSLGGEPTGTAARPARGDPEPAGRFRPITAFVTAVDSEVRREELSLADLSLENVVQWNEPQARGNGCTYTIRGGTKVGRARSFDPMRRWRKCGEPAIERRS